MENEILMVRFHSSIFLFFVVVCCFFFLSFFFGGGGEGGRGEKRGTGRDEVFKDGLVVSYSTHPSRGFSRVI